MTNKQEKYIIKIWEENPHLTNKEKTQLFNDKFGTNFVSRTLQQRASNYIKGKRDTMKENLTEKELQRIGNARKKLLVEQKITTIIKGDLHKDAQRVALVSQAMKEIKETLNKSLPKTKVRVPKKIPYGTPEYIISDIHFRGGKDEIQRVRNMFALIDQDAQGKKISLAFLGDDVEGTSAHMSQLMAVKTGMINQALELAKVLVEEIKKLNVVSIVFVTQSNHGQIRPLGSSRNEFPKEDVGYVIDTFLRTSLPNIKFEKENNGIVETKDTIYLHGHQGFAGNKNRMFAHLGNKKHIIMGHYHHLKVTQEGSVFLIVAPAAKIENYDYEKQGGYKSKPGIIKLTRKKNKIEIIRILYL